MGAIDGQEVTPVIFEYSATHYCKYCHTWGTARKNDITDIDCGNCGMAGYLIKNPFPDNMIPYVVLSAQPVKGDKLT